MRMQTDGSIEVLRLAELIAHELRAGGKGDIRVIGWIGSTGHGGTEYAVEVGGKTTALEVGDDDIRAFPTDHHARLRVGKRIRRQMLGLLD